MDNMLIVASDQGIAICEKDGKDWQTTRTGLDGQRITSVTARQGVILAGSRAGIYRSEDLGMTWGEANTGLSIPYVRWLAFHPDLSDFELTGTEPAGIFISRDGGGSWRECPEVAEMRDRFGWSLPYSPQAGCVRGFAIHGKRAYAAVEDGCVLVSEDGGKSWQLASGSRGYPDHNPLEGYIHSDVHSIAVHPSSPDLVFAPTGGGFYRSGDGGKTWQCIYRHTYVRAVWVDPQDPEHMIIGPADSVDRNGRIEASRDGGQTWESASPGLSVPWGRHMVERFAQVGDEIIAVLSNGELISSPRAELEWRRILPGLVDVNGVDGMHE
jgi:photosystem II stability/assembly factor-like uncharacterized protein